MEIFTGIAGLHGDLYQLRRFAWRSLLVEQIYMSFFSDRAALHGDLYL